MNHFAIIFLYIIMRCIPKSLLSDVVSISVLEVFICKLVKMLLGMGVRSVMTSSTAGKLAIEYWRPVIHTHT